MSFEQGNLNRCDLLPKLINSQMELARETALTVSHALEKYRKHLP